MKKRIGKKWVKALRSGEYDQCQGNLVSSTNGEDSFCCLGVLADVQGYEFIESTTLPWEELNNRKVLALAHPDYKTEAAARRHGDAYCLPKWARAGMKDEEMDELINMNDCEGKTFEQIADHVEKNLID